MGLVLQSVWAQFVWYSSDLKKQPIATLGSLLMPSWGFSSDLQNQSSLTETHRHCVLSIMREIVVRIMLKAPSKYSIVRNMSCIDPFIVAVNLDSCVKVQESTMDIGEQRQGQRNKWDGILQQYSDVFVHAIVPSKDTFTQFDPFDAGRRLDSLLRKHMNKPELSDLWCVVSQLLLLTHGQAIIERGCSVNKEMEVDNLCLEMFIAQRIVHDHIISVGDMMWWWWWWWWLMFYGHFCAQGRLNGPSDLQS